MGLSLEGWDFMQRINDLDSLFDMGTKMVVLVNKEELDIYDKECKLERDLIKAYKDIDAVYGANEKFLKGRRFALVFNKEDLTFDGFVDCSDEENEFLGKEKVTTVRPLGYVIMGREEKDSGVVFRRDENGVLHKYSTR
jgi:glycerol-3-phosphate responsive antiterminator